MPKKPALRQHFRQLRAKLTPAKISLASAKMKEKLNQHPRIEATQKIGAYLPINNELDLTPSLNMLKQQNKEIFVPILHPWHPKFWFAPWRPEMRPNKFGIPEPLFSPKDLLAPWDLEVILVPLLAADKHHYRLGMGQGYYDQSLAFKTAHELPYLIGCAYEFQLSPTDLPHDTFDICLDEIIFV